MPDITGPLVDLVTRWIGDYGALVTSGDMGSAVNGARRLAETFDSLRELNGQPVTSAA